MTTIFEIVDDALASLDPAVSYAWDQYLVGSDESLPDLYLVPSLVDSPPVQHADNEETERMYRIQVSAYQRDGLLNLPDVDGAMKAKGFMKSNVVRLPRDPDTGHFGLATDYTILLNSN